MFSIFKKKKEPQVIAWRKSLLFLAKPSPSARVADPFSPREFGKIHPKVAVQSFKVWPAGGEVKLEVAGPLRSKADYQSACDQLAATQACCADWAVWSVDHPIYLEWYEYQIKRLNGDIRADLVSITERPHVFSRSPTYFGEVVVYLEIPHP
jgi:hypothetical protein